MLGQSNHTVKWLNYTEEETNSFVRLNFPVAYIHAKFYHPIDEKKLIGSDDSEDETVIVEGPIPTTSTAVVWKASAETKDNGIHWPIYDSEMKCLVRLQRGANEVKVSAFSQEFILNFQYEPWESPTKRFVKLVYIVCDESDGTFLSPSTDNDIAAAKKRLSLNALMLQTFVAENLNAHDLGRITFELEEPCNEPPVNIFLSKLKLKDARSMTGGELYKYFHKELNASNLHDTRCKFLTFMSCTGYAPPTAPGEFNPRKAGSYVQAHTALGGGNLALFGTGGLHTWASSIEQVPKKFTDETVIDKRKLFDDSWGRGTYWANYATTLGATMHELGHTFDLAHTRNGIMGRGFDDMDQFFVATERAAKNQSSELAYYNGGSHWFRSSAVILKSHKWLTQIPDPSSNVHQEFSPIIFTDPFIRGPFGSSTYLKNQQKFDSRDWCEQSNTDLVGIVVYYDEYLHALEFIGRKRRNDKDVEEDDEEWEEIVAEDVGKEGGSATDADATDNQDEESLGTTDKESVVTDAKKIKKEESVKEKNEEYHLHDNDDLVDLCVRHGALEDGNHEDCQDSELVYSPRYGAAAEDWESKYTFWLDQSSKERILAIDIRAGAWIDSVRFHSTMKSSHWCGGSGGSCYRVMINHNLKLHGLFGTFADMVGSLGVSMMMESHEYGSCRGSKPSKKVFDDIHLEASGKIQVVEVQDNDGTVVKYFDFSNEANHCAVIKRSAIAKYLPCRLYLIDDKGLLAGIDVE